MRFMIEGHEAGDRFSLVEAGPQALRELCGRYGLEMDLSSIPLLIERFGVRLSSIFQNRKSA